MIAWRICSGRFGLLLLFIWLSVAQLMPEFIHNLHGPIFGLSDHELDLIFYYGMGLLILGVRGGQYA